MATSDAELPDELISELDVELRVYFRRGRALAARLAAEAAPDLDAAVFSILMAIGRAGLTQASDVAAYFGVGKGAVSRQLSTLVDLGLVRRSVDEHDARAQRLELTDDGARAVRDATRIVRRSLSRIFAGWSADEAEQFIAYLHRVNVAIG